MAFEIFKEIGTYGIVPLVTLDDPNDAVPLAHALVDGGIPIAEVTFRTAAGGESIKRMAKEVPEIIVGAGTVHNLDQAKQTLDNGGKFIITPGFNYKVVEWALEHNMPICPGTVVPSDIEEAMNYGLDTVKFFPAEAYGGINTLKNLAAPFASVKFVPTGGVNLNNLQAYLDQPNVAAVGGSFVPPSKLVKAKDWAGITALCQEIMKKVVDLRPGHVGINAGTDENARAVTSTLCKIFDTEFKDTPLAYFAGDLAEVMKVPFKGTHGHYCVETRDMPRAVAYLKRKGIAFDEKSFVYDAKGKLIAAYLADEVGGFAFHLRYKTR
ncbi:MAG TPA: bifunctional 4-hydroxy-2-oxoglutarate aldolase/2-dehydro-3-deoxy-phosphogluconate aldolase [Candidatus Avisuccinivibrio pullicola]|nr:bifunctional 4-hydroxy-2-oxoglutarate aldolase/2-dehydro-3-deoxy-phosphogluconate aldolase [Candidatus Avisuccinivibrio pullicola]